MKSDDFLAELVELDTFPADFDPYFFNEIAGRFFVSGESIFVILIYMFCFV